MSRPSWPVLVKVYRGEVSGVPPCKERTVNVRSSISVVPGTAMRQLSPAGGESWVTVYVRPSGVVN